MAEKLSSNQNNKKKKKWHTRKIVTIIGFIASIITIFTFIITFFSSDKDDNPPAISPYSSSDILTSSTPSSGDNESDTLGPEWAYVETITATSTPQNTSDTHYELVNSNYVHKDENTMHWVHTYRVYKR